MGFAGGIFAGAILSGTLADQLAENLTMARAFRTIQVALSLNHQVPDLASREGFKSSGEVGAVLWDAEHSFFPFPYQVCLESTRFFFGCQPLFLFVIKNNVSVFPTARAQFQVSDIHPNLNSTAI